MQLFYHPDIGDNQSELIFPRHESKHIVKVLRKRAGDILFITNGKGSLFETQVTHADQNKCMVQIIEIKHEAPPWPSLHLLVAPTKMNDRFEWFLEKTTEIGVQEITPIICDHSERSTIKEERFERVLQSALKQSLGTYLPILHKQKNFKDIVESAIVGQKFIAHCEDQLQRKQLSEELKKGTHTTILIGPEGDFSKDEIRLALKNGWIPVSLGNSRLRTETAAIVGCHTFALINQ